jgi:hypothetical protein
MQIMRAHLSMFLSKITFKLDWLIIALDLFALSKKKTKIIQEDIAKNHL